MSLESKWARSIASRHFNAELTLSETGLTLGAGTILARMTKSDRGSECLDLEEDHDRIIALLACSASPLPSVKTMAHIAAAAEYWERGDKALALIRLAFGRLPRLTCLHDGYRLFLADEALALSVSPFTVMKEIGCEASATALLKTAGQFHVPSGNGRRSGQFTSGPDGLAPTPVFLPTPAPTGVSIAPIFPAPDFDRPAAPLPDPHVKPVPGESGGGSPSTNSDDDDPKKCSAPVPDVKRGARATSDAYEVDVHIEVNQLNPLKLGEAILYHGIYFDDCARQDDPQGRWKAGDMFEAKGPGYEKLLTSDFSWISAGMGLMDQADRQDKALFGTSRRNTHLVAEDGAAGMMRTMFVPFVHTSVFHFEPVTIVPTVRSRKLFTSGDAIWI